jgi:hypothetical protein
MKQHKIEELLDACLLTDEEMLLWQVEYFSISTCRFRCVMALEYVTNLFPVLKRQSKVVSHTPPDVTSLDFASRKPRAVAPK